MVRRLIRFLFLLVFFSCNNLDTEYYDTGEIKAKIPISNGEINGEVLEFYKNGNLKSKTQWENGLINGLSETYSKKGLLRQVLTFKNGIKNGAIKEYYDTGEIKREGFFKDGKLYDDFKSFFKNGQLKKKGKYFDGGVSYREYYKTGHPRLYSYKKKSSSGDTIFYFKEYSKNGHIEKFSLPTAIDTLKGDLCISISHTFIPKNKIELVFSIGRFDNIQDALTSTNQLFADDTIICIPSKKLQGINEGFLIERVKGESIPYAYKKIVF